MNEHENEKMLKMLVVFQGFALGVIVCFGAAYFVNIQAFDALPIIVAVAVLYTLIRSLRKNNTDR